MRSRNTEDHLTPEGVPGDKSDYGENNARIFSTIDDDTRVIPAVEFRNIKFAYDDQNVLNDISFRVMRGELLIVLSPSGGGKSTILKLALGLMKPDEGRILIDGEDITDYDEEALNVTLLSQSESSGNGSARSCASRRKRSISSVEIASTSASFSGTGRSVLRSRGVTVCTSSIQRFERIWAPDSDVACSPMGQPDYCD